MKRHLLNFSFAFILSLAFIGNAYSALPAPSAQDFDLIPNLIVFFVVVPLFVIFVATFGLKLELINLFSLVMLSAINILILFIQIRQGTIDLITLKGLSRSFLTLLPSLIYGIFYRKKMKNIETWVEAEQTRLSSLTLSQLKKENETKAENLKKLKEEIKENTSKFTYGELSQVLVCPHCQSKGTVRSKNKILVEKSRVNSVAGKAIGLGMNKEKPVTQLHCDNCKMTWNVE